MLQFDEPRRVRAGIDRQIALATGNSATDKLIEYATCEVLARCVVADTTDTRSALTISEREVLPQYRDLVLKRVTTARLLLQYALFVPNVESRVKIEAVRSLMMNIVTMADHCDLEYVRMNVHDHTKVTLSDQAFASLIVEIFSTAWQRLRSI